MTTARHDRLAHRAWPTVSAKSLVLVPIGSTEQHGPHLPLNTDSVIAESVAGRAAEELSARLTPPPLVAPTLAYGASGEHAGFPGTVSLGHEALHAVIVETVRSLSLWAGRVVFVNGHGGNTATLDAALGALRAEGHAVAWAGCGITGGDAHAGRTETSLMLYLAPEEVRILEAVAGDTRPLDVLMPLLTAHGVKAVSPSGVLGNPAGASAEEGRRHVRTMVSRLVGLITAATTDERGRLLDPAARDRPGTKAAGR